jgi:protein-tyrosine phosphatase
VDAPDVNYIPAQIIDAALDDIRQNIASSKVLVYCNQGMSRSPAIAFLYLLKFTDVFRRQNCDEDLRDFLNGYPAYLPARGIADYVKLNWVKYSSRG